MAVACLGAHAVSAAECPEDRTPLLILGTFHMEGSADDAVSRPLADISTPRRQAEIKDLVARLAAFRPTRVAIESSRISTYWNERYAAWRVARHELGFNEIEQVGFRLADAVGVTALSPVDYPMWMDGSTAIDRHDPPQPPRPPRQPSEPTPPEAESPLMKEVNAQLALDERMLRNGTISEYLAYLNQAERAVKNHRWDVISNLAPGTGIAMYEATDLATHWYKRNLRIYTNLVAISGPGQRVLFLVGAGHTHVLNEIAANDPRFCRVDAATFLSANPESTPREDPAEPRLPQ